MSLSGVDLDLEGVWNIRKNVTVAKSKSNQPIYPLTTGSYSRHGAVSTRGVTPSTWKPPTPSVKMVLPLQVRRATIMMISLSQQVSEVSGSISRTSLITNFLNTVDCARTS